ncbi:MAG: nuclear transport factor 2 family protein [Ignavibacteriales bacterium]|nr:nuclear transport factor 2 family protein [Ignavibacteriales bacterium]
MDELKIKEEILGILEKLNRSWAVEHNTEKLKEYFHENMVVLEPGRKERREGRKECIDGWKNFVEATKIHYWKESDHKVQLYGDGKFAVVTYYWDMSYDMNDQTFTLGGRDMFVMVKEDGKWWAVADQFSPNPS